MKKSKFTTTFVVIINDGSDEIIWTTVNKATWSNIYSYKNLPKILTWFWTNRYKFCIDESQQLIDNSAYKAGPNIVTRICVLNDTAEKGVKSNEECNDDEQKQYLLQILKDYKNKYSDCKMSTLQ